MPLTIWNLRRLQRGFALAELPFWGDAAPLM
jgi:hypothetical protein